MKKLEEIFDKGSLKGDLYGVLASFNRDNDLTLALTATSYIDACLTEYLSSKLRRSKVTDKLLGHKGALGGLVAKAEMAYASKFIEKEYYQDISLMAEVRNNFAHLHKKVSFSDQDIIDKCEKLNLPGIIPASEVEEHNREHVANMFKDARIRFSAATIQLSNRLLYDQAS